MNPTISLAPSGNLLLSIPSVLAEGRSQVLEIPLTLGGLSLIKKILVERSRDPTPSLGKRSMPIAADIHKFLVERQHANDAALRERYGDIELEL